MVLRGTWKRILLFLLGILFFQGKSLFAQVSVAVFPLKATDVPTESNASSINGIISNAIAASSIGRFTTAQIGETLDDPAVPPDPKSASDCTYSLTSELLYDTTRSETQLYLYLYDNTTEKLVVSDQLVYQTETEAEEFAPFLVDSILDRIPKYDITVKKPDGGTISFNGQPLEISEDTQVIREQGAGTIQLSAQGQTGKSFQAWEITGANVDGNILIITETANPYSLELSTEKYTGTGTSAEDPFGTIVPLTIEAQFGRGSGSTEYEPQFNVNLGWSPSMQFASGDAVFDLTFQLGGVFLGFDWFAFREKWGNIGFGLYGNYNYLSSSKRGQTANAQMVNGEVRAFYEFPLLANLFAPRIVAGFGAAWISDIEIQKGDSSETYSLVSNYNFRATLGLGFDIYILPQFCIKLGAAASWCFPWYKFVYGSMDIGMGFKF